MTRLDKILSILGDSSKQRFRESYFEKNYNGLYQEIIEYTKTLDIEKFPQRVWHWVYDLNTQHLCKTCNKQKTSFNKNWLDGYRDFCSSKCSAVSTSTKDKRKETCLEIYGVDNVAKNEIVKSKTETTNIERYGFKSTFQNEIVRDKWKETILKKYGTDHYFKTKDFNKKYEINKKNTLLSKYNSTTIFQSKYFKDKSKESREKRIIEKYKNYFRDDYIINDYNNSTFNIKHIVCNKNFNIELHTLIDRKKK